MPKKTEGGILWDFSTSILSQNSKKNEGGLFGVNFFFKKNVQNAEKTQRWDPLVSPGFVCYAEKKEKPFWFSSLGHQVQWKTLRKSHDYSRLFSQELTKENQSRVCG